MSLADELGKIHVGRFEAAFAGVMARADLAEEAASDREIEAMNLAAKSTSPALQTFTDRLLDGEVVTLPGLSEREVAAFGVGVTATILALTEYARTDELRALLGDPAIE
jgi:hypothetical protein